MNQGHKNCEVGALPLPCLLTSDIQTKTNNTASHGSHLLIIQVLSHRKRTIEECNYATKHLHFKISGNPCRIHMGTPTLAWYFPICIGYTKTISNFKNPKVYVSEPRLSTFKSHRDHVLRLLCFQIIIVITCWVS